MVKTIQIKINSKDYIGKTNIYVSPYSKIRLVDITYDKWLDKNIPSHPLVGWANIFFNLFSCLKQSKIHNYMQLIYSVGSSTKDSVYRSLKKNNYLVFNYSGELYIKANDIFCLGILWFYNNNEGTATLTFQIED